MVLSREDIYIFIAETSDNIEISTLYYYSLLCEFVVVKKQFNREMSVHCRERELYLNYYPKRRTCLAVLAGVSTLAGATVFIDQVRAIPVVFARCVVTFVNL